MNPKGPAIIDKYTREIFYLAPDLGITEFDAPGDAVVADGGGRMFVRSLLPEKRIVRRIGGVAIKSVEAVPGNKGDGQIKQIKTLLGACTETLAVKCVEGGPGAKFDVTSSVFGKIGTAKVGKAFTDDPRHPQYRLVSRRFWVGGENPEPSLRVDSRNERRGHRRRSPDAGRPDLRGALHGGGAAGRAHPGDCKVQSAGRPPAGQVDRARRQRRLALASARGFLSVAPHQ